MTDLRRMLETHNTYVQSFVTIDEQLQAGLLPQSVCQSRSAGRLISM